MITGTLPKGTIFYNRPETPVYEEEVKNLKAKRSFLYIGNSSERTTNCFSFFDHGFVIGNYEEAKSILLELNENGILPDFIIVDLSLNVKEIFHFVLWLHSNKWSFMIPVLYNETILSSSELTTLRELNIADDIVNIETYCSQLNPKASLLKESKMLQRTENSKPEDEIANPLINISIGKRIFDITVSSICLILLSPLFLIISLIIKLESKGPVIYISRRAGRGFRVFNFYKFRTMVHNADKKVDEYMGLNLYANKQNDGSSFFKIKNDPRITRVGSFLRNTSLDELPQLFNVLKGDMSIVGNRPLPLYEATTLTTNKNAERFIAPAGITGLWQVTKRGRDDMDIDERIGLDVNYARKQGFLMDFRILMQTPFALFQKSNV